MAVASSKSGAEDWGKLGASGAGTSGAGICSAGAEKSEAEVEPLGSKGVAWGSGIVMGEPFNCRGGPGGRTATAYRYQASDRYQRPPRGTPDWSRR